MLDCDVSWCELPWVYHQFLLFLWNSDDQNVKSFVNNPTGVWDCLCYFNLFYLLYSDYLSIVLSSSSLIRFSISVILELSPSFEFFILHIYFALFCICFIVYFYLENFYLVLVSISLLTFYFFGWDSIFSFVSKVFLVAYWRILWTLIPNLCQIILSFLLSQCGIY